MYMSVLTFFTHYSLVCSMQEQRDISDADFSKLLCYDVARAHALVNGRDPDLPTAANSVTVVKMTWRRRYAVLDLVEAEDTTLKRAPSFARVNSTDNKITRHAEAVLLVKLEDVTVCPYARWDT